MHLAQRQGINGPNTVRQYAITESQILASLRNRTADVVGQQIVLV